MKPYQPAITFFTPEPFKLPNRLPKETQKPKNDQSTNYYSDSRQRDTQKQSNPWDSPDTRDQPNPYHQPQPKAYQQSHQPHSQHQPSKQSKPVKPSYYPHNPSPVSFYQGNSFAENRCTLHLILDISDLQTGTNSISYTD